MERSSVTRASFFWLVRKHFTWPRLIALAAAAFCVYLFVFGWHSRHFELQWDEEVELADGRVVVVHVRRTFERLRFRFDPYAGAITRDTELSFDAGGTTGRVTQLLKGYAPILLDEEQGRWYLMIYGGSYGKARLIPGQNFGLSWYGCGPVLQLRGAHFVPISVHDLPAAFKQPNFLMFHGEIREHALFHGRLVTVSEKREWRRTRPPRNHQEFGICRPPKNTVKPLDLFHYNPVQRETR